tara:strand:- start:9122 stop:9784 length:663 start_codon:yes stop_codon:yes gene_type:complete
MAVSPLTVGLVTGGLSILGGLDNNAAIAKQAASQFNANTLFIERDKSVVNNQIGLQGRDVNAEVGAALTNLGYQAAQASSQVATSQADRNVYGNSARRQQIAVDMQKALTADNLAQAAEAKMLQVQQQYTEAKYQSESRHIKNSEQYQQAMSQQTSSFDMIAGAAMAGFSGYSQGLSIESSQRAIDAQKEAAQTTRNKIGSFGSNSGSNSSYIPNWNFRG